MLAAPSTFLLHGPHTTLTHPHPHPTIMTGVAMSGGHYAQQAQAFVLRLPEHLEESVRARLKTGGMDGVQLTARPDGFEGLRECCGGGREGGEREGCVCWRGEVLLRSWGGLETSRELGMVGPALPSRSPLLPSLPTPSSPSFNCRTASNLACCSHSFPLLINLTQSPLYTHTLHSRVRSPEGRPVGATTWGRKERPPSSSRGCLETGPIATRAALPAGAAGV